MHDRLRIFYAAGPGNVIGTYRHWKAGRDDPSQMAVTYSGQFYDVMRALDAEGLVIASCPVAGCVRDGHVRIEHRRLPLATSRGPLYHLGQICYGLGLVASALSFRADVAVVCGGTHWFVLSLLALFRVRVVASLHCTLWQEQPVRGGGGILRALARRLDGWFLRHCCTGILSISSKVTRQVWSLCGRRGLRAPPLETFVPIYRRGALAGIAAPPRERCPFRLLFVGRIEKNKGVFDLLAIARRFSEAGRTDIEFDLCGTGSAYGELSAGVHAAGLGARFRLHGHCTADTLRAIYGRCHVVIAPTHTDFLEGFNKVVVEGVLAGRPVITSSVCPSLELVREAVLEVTPNDVKGYGDAILRLCDEPELYAAMTPDAALGEAFYDQRQSWGAVLKSIIMASGSRRSALRTVQVHEQLHSRRRSRPSAKPLPIPIASGWRKAEANALDGAQDRTRAA